MLESYKKLKLILIKKWSFEKKTTNKLHISQYFVNQNISVNFLKYDNKKLNIFYLKFNILIFYKDIFKYVCWM